MGGDGLAPPMDDFPMEEEAEEEAPEEGGEEEAPEEGGDFPMEEEAEEEVLEKGGNDVDISPSVTADGSDEQDKDEGGCEGGFGYCSPSTEASSADLSCCPR